MPQDVIAETSLHNVVTFSIDVNGNVLDASFQVLSISITKELNRIPNAKIVFRDGDAAERDFAISNQESLIPGSSISIKIGIDGTNAQAFKGTVVKHSIKIKENGDSELIIECRDDTMKMTIGRKSNYYDNKKDSELFDELIGKYSGLNSDIQPTRLVHKQIVQHHISDWDFMLMRAEANAMLINVTDGTIKIAAPDTTTSPVITLSYGLSVLEFEAEMDARNQWKSVAASSWDYANQQLFNADTDVAGNFSEFGNIRGSDLADTVNLSSYEMHHSGYLLEQELQDWVNGIMMRSRLAKIRGRAKFSGSTIVNPGDMVTLEGVGNRFNGNAFVTAVKHDIGKGMWDTHIQFGLDPRRYGEVYNDLNDLQASGLTGSINGLQIGKVVQLQNDPDGQDRIMVKTPTIDNNSSGIWARVASLDAGADRGAFFMPEIDDEVIIGFINNDPRHAVVLGMLHSSAKPAPITASDANHEKGFTTRSKMHISFNDQNKTIKIDTPAGNSILLDEQGTQIEIKDQNNNKITMGTSGIAIESPMNIDIKAGANLTISAKASLSVSGVSVSAKADGNISVEGAMAKLAGHGMTEITGGLVKIN